MQTYPGLSSIKKSFVFTEEEINEEKNKILKSVTLHITDLIEELRRYLFSHLQLTLRKDYLDPEYNIKIKEISFCITIVKQYTNEILTSESEWANESEDNVFNHQSVIAIFSEAIEEFSGINTQAVENTILSKKMIIKNQYVDQMHKVITRIISRHDLDANIDFYITENGQWNIYSVDFKIHNLAGYILNLKKNKIDYSDHIKTVTVVVRKHPDFRVISWMNNNYEKNIKDIAEDLFATDVKNMVTAIEDKDIIFHSYLVQARKILRSRGSKDFRKYFGT